MREETAQSLAVPAALAAALLWSSGGVLIKLVSWQPLAVAGWRSLIAAVFLILICRWPGLPKSREAIAAAVAYAATVVLFVVATKLTTAANAILLQFTAPIYVALLAPWLTGERISRLDWLATLLVMAGIGLFFADDLDFSGMLGNILGLVCGVSFALVILFLRRTKGNKPYAFVIHGNLLAALICLPWMFNISPGMTDITGILSLGVFQLGMGYFIYSWAVPRVGAVTAVLVTVVEPILNPVWVFLSIGETPGPYALIGGALVIVVVTARGLFLYANKRRLTAAH